MFSPAVSSYCQKPSHSATFCLKMDDAGASHSCFGATIEGNAATFFHLIGLLDNEQDMVEAGRDSPMKVFRTMVAFAVVMAAASFGMAGEMHDFRPTYDGFIRTAMDRLNARYGMAVAVVQHDSMVFEGYYGSADIDAGRPVTPATEFYIASSTKSFTALAALLLERQGKLDFDRSLQAYFPEIEFAEGLPADSIYLPNLLSHTAGINNLPMLLLTAFSGEHDRHILEQVVALTRPNDKAPLGTFAYTNIGYNIAGLIIERETGRAWQEAVTDEVLKPLGLSHTSCYMSVLEENGWPFAEPHSCEEVPGQVVRVDARKVDKTMHAAGGIITTARDMCRWLRVQLGDGAIDGRQVFPRDVVQTSHRLQAECDKEYGPYQRHAYGFGWYLGSYHGETVMHHFGGFTGAHAQIAFMPEYDMGVVVLVNEASIGGDFACLVSSYACDYFSGQPDLDSLFAVKLDSTRVEMDDMTERLSARQTEHAHRKWQLDLPMDRFAGTYRHPLYGTLHVDHEGGDTLRLRLGVMSAVAEPYPDTNAVRVDMPPGYGSVIRFTIDGDGVKSADLKGMIFPRVN